MPSDCVICGDALHAPCFRLFGSLLNLAVEEADRGLGGACGLCMTPEQIAYVSTNLKARESGRLNRTLIGLLRPP